MLNQFLPSVLVWSTKSVENEFEAVFSMPGTSLDVIVGIVLLVVVEVELDVAIEDETSGEMVTCEVVSDKVVRGMLTPNDVE